VATTFTDDDRVLLLVVDITERERADSIRRDFVANASHELKTPVATIIASSEALQIALDRGDDSATAFAGRIESSARQLDRLVTDLLDLSRLEKESPELHPTRLDRLVRDEVERIRGEAVAKGIEIEVRTDEVTATINHRDVAIAVRNILDNAIRYTAEDGSIVVTVAVDGAVALVTVSDSGEGVPTRDNERIFERFYRVDSARSRATGGTGLGSSSNARYAAPLRAVFHSIASFRPVAAHSRKYKLISVWYGISVSSARVLKCAIVDSSRRMVTERFSFAAYGFFRAFEKS
jgi:two-component system sensor histidine kinase SenX3